MPNQQSFYFTLVFLLNFFNHIYYASFIPSLSVFHASSLESFVVSFLYFSFSLTVCSRVPCFSFQYVIFLLSVLSVPGPSYSSVWPYFPCLILFFPSLLFSTSHPPIPVFALSSWLSLRSFWAKFLRYLFSYKINQHFASKVLLSWVP